MSRILYGIHSVSEALKHMPKQVRQIWYDSSRKKALADILHLAGQENIPVSATDRKTLESKCRNGKHQGIVCQAAEFRYASLKDFLQEDQERSRIIVIADQVQDPQNIGGILRAMGAFGADLLVVGKHRGATVTPAVVKTSAGGATVIPVAKENSLSNVLEQLKKKGFWIFGLEADGETCLSDQDLSGNIALVVGSEGRGLSHLVRKRCDLVCRLPQQGPLNSLNAAMALACSLYEVARQRTQK
jgi:23S rRNA (guanosine2251-2'-O)-methyltransferase